MSHDEADADAAPPSPFRGSSAHATLMLVIVTLFWGLSFPLVKRWQIAAEGCPGGELVASLTVIAVRMFLALGLLAVFRPRLFRAPTRREQIVGTVLGLTFFAGFTLQMLGLAWTTPALSAFITSLGSAWVPLVAFVFFRITAAPVTLLGLALGVVGTAILANPGAGTWSLGGGEGLTLLASVIFAWQILILDRWGRGLDSTHLSVPFFGANGVSALLLILVWLGDSAGVRAWWGWLVEVLSRPAVVADVLLLSVFSTVIAFTWMNTYQPRVSATRAALIYLLEPVFAAILSLALGYDDPSLRLALGGGLILGGNLLVELPAWLRRA